MLLFLLAYSVPLLTGPMPLVPATFGVALGAEDTAGGFGAERREDVVGRAGVEGRAAVVRTGGGSLGALGACWSLVGTAGP
jgi:hypothetical protein